MNRSDLPFVPIGGLPHSGSTLLVNFMAQNPAFKLTPASGVAAMLSCVRESWNGNEQFMAWGLKDVEPRIASMMWGQLYGFYKEDIDAGRAVFDLGRGWPLYLELLEILCERPVPMLIATRDLRDVVASAERAWRRSPMSRPPTGITVEERAASLLDPKSYIGTAINILRGAVQKGLADRLVLVPYEIFTVYPQRTMDALHDAFGLERFQYDPNHVEQKIVVDDGVYRLDLHTIRPKIEPQTRTWLGVLPNGLADTIDRRYPMVQSMHARAVEMYRTKFERVI